MSSRLPGTPGLLRVLAGALVLGGMACTKGGGFATSESASSVTSSTAAAALPVGATGASNALAGRSFYADGWRPVGSSSSSCSAQYPQRPGLFDKVMNQPVAFWFGDWNTNLKNDIEQKVKAAAQVGAWPVLVAYNIPHRDCGYYSAGGAEEQAYESWITAFAKAIGNYPAVVVLEPDALPMADPATGCLQGIQSTKRIDLMVKGLRALRKEAPKAKIYLDIGHARWLSVAVAASLLREAKISEADGFTLNISNFVSTEENLTYGKAVSDLVGGKHFIIDTGRNGNGSAPDGANCNPPGRALGEKPRTLASGVVDAYMWIKPPGESDGGCHGYPSAGTFVIQLACDLAAGAHW